MTEPTKPRPILKLSGGRPASLGPPPAPLIMTGWRCKPCGHPVEVPALVDADPADYVRCSKCNARLGTVGDFHADPPPLGRLRVRSAKLAAPAPPAPPKTEGVTVTVVRRAPRPGALGKRS
jgi:hypothetical protein